MIGFRQLLFAALAITAVAAQSDAGDAPLAVAHRGLLLHAPENTLVNFRACLELRLGFEFDVQRTRDGELVCIHDSRLNRTTNGQGNVADSTLREIRALDAGSWFDSKFAGEKVPTIDEVLSLLALYRQHELLVAVDVKTHDTAVDLVRLAEQRQVLHRLLFIGLTISEPSIRQQLKQASRNVQTAAVANHPGEFPLALTAVDADWVYLRFLPSQAEIEAARRAKRPVFIAGPTVSGLEPKNWQHAASAGVDAILTDYPLELRGMLRQGAAK